ncbi:PIG-L family deacetylase [Variovorax sp. VNK109]|jgi:LmbE family N-acetylglucosaminyl deacetylase/CheY-like chemotaxis protein|uniref:PIG-L family deacetylase n=1 Tax=Variovorax sp. VNK109 TaxID=3400919 RepID=UPI003C0347B2
MATGEESSQLHVLLIEDSPEYALMMRRWLEEDRKIAVTHAADGTSGATLARSRVWDLVVTDVELPGLDGLELLSAVKAGDPWTPVLVITAHKSVEYAQKALQNRADGLLFKPFPRNEFLTTAMQLVISALARRARERKLVLAIGAHPDDVEIGCGGTLEKHRMQGDSIIILTLSEGMSGGDPKTRNQEARNAAELLGAQLRWGGLLDTEIPEGAMTISVIEDVIRQLRPTHVYTHSQYDSHQDHRNAHHATIVAARDVPNLYCYQSPSSMVEFRPHLFIDISNHIDAKLAAIAAYRSQTSQRAYLKEDLIRATARYWGRFAGYVLAEPMEVVRQRDS